MKFYKKNDFPIDDKLFQNPSSEYRGTPFWAWNCQMTEQKNTMMINMFKEMGMGGGHIHSRTGMNNPYLGEEFMKLVQDAHQKFAEHKMLTWLYDEDRWPSGAAGGLVTRDHQYRLQFLVFSPRKITKTQDFVHVRCGAEAVRSDERVLLGRYQVLLENGWLKEYSRLDEQEEATEGYDEWFAYLEVSGDSTWFNNQAYVNTLDKKAMDRFIEVTHEAYARYLGDEFGKSVPAIFTDEPQFCHKQKLNYANEKRQIILPFTEDLEESFIAACGHSLLNALPELIWERETEISVIRYQYHDHVCERFATAFGDNIATWCEKHNLMLTGHMMEEATLRAQTSALGEVMRSLRSFQLPGIDMLFERRELSTAKQAQSIAHQYGRIGVMSELYGGSNWDYDFRGFKLQGDWQAALGVTIRVPHLSWTSMAGEAKRDYPVPIGYQSPWYKEYKYIEDYFARINTIMSRGQADVRVGMIHPIESYWLYWGTEEKTGGIREELDEDFKHIIDWLLYGCIDFDFISESLLDKQNDINKITGSKLTVGKMNYDVLVVPNCVTLRKSTVERIKIFAKQGGTVIFAGRIPEYVDALPSEQVKKIAEACVHIPFQRTKLLESLETYRVVGVRNQNGAMTQNLIYQLRTDGDNKLLFLAHVNPMQNPDMPEAEVVTITIRGEYHVQDYNPLDGVITSVTCRHQNGYTIITKTMYEHDSLLLVLSPYIKNTSYETRENNNEKRTWLKLTTDSEVEYELSEPNVFRLDQAEYAFDDGTWQDKEELLRIDSKFRELLNYPARTGSVVQPWTIETEEESKHTLSLRFCIHSEVEVNDVVLALENQTAKVVWNQAPVVMDYTGWYVDQEIQTVKLGTIHKGKNELVVEIPYRHKENVENMFLLGDFGVQVQGSKGIITSLPDKMTFSDITYQGFPFYGGNITYKLPVHCKGDGKIKIVASKFRSPLLKVRMNDEVESIIAFSPYEVELPCVNGQNRIHLTVFGNRANTFGPIHNCSEALNFSAPKSWRSQDNAWSYEYQFKRNGILKSPDVYWMES